MKRQLVYKPQKKDSIEICVLLYAFQKRFWWMLSSLVQQIKHQEHAVPVLRIKLNIHKDDPFREFTDKLLSTFSPLLDFKIKIYNDQKFGCRGYTRNFDIKECTSDWILFTDADDVFHPQMFAQIGSRLEGWKKERKVITVPRYTMNKEEGYKLIDSESYNDLLIKNSFDRVFSKNIGFSGKGRAPGAGFFQLVNVKMIKSMGINTYVDAFSDRNLFSEKGNKFKTDIRFRKKFDGVLPVRNLFQVMHIAHHHYRSPLNDMRCL